MTRPALVLLMSFGAIVALTLCHTPPASAAIVVDPHNTGATDVDPADPSTWDYSSTSGFIGKTGSGEIEVNGGSEINSKCGYIGYESTAMGQVTITGTDSTWKNKSQYFIIGGYGNSNGTLNITSGGTVRTTSGEIGCYSGSMGQVTVDGIDSRLNSLREFSVGEHGNGTLNIINGGTVTVTDHTYVGHYAESTGIINFGTNGGTLSTGSLWISSTQLTGTGTISTHGLVSDLDLVFDSTHGLTQTLLVDNYPDQNIAIQLNMSGGYVSNGCLGAGYRENGSLTIRDGKSVNSYYGYLGYHSDTTGVATVTGPGSRWTSTQRLYIGYEGNGVLNITDGGMVQFSSDIYVGYDDESTGIINFGEGGGTLATATLWGAPSQLMGTGTVNVHGLVSDVDLVFDTSHGLVQTLTLSDEPDQNVIINLNLTNNYGALGAGYQGKGSLIIRDGMTVLSSEGCLGFHGGSTGVATVTGANSTWNTFFDLDVGRNGNGTLEITAGGTVNISQSWVGYDSGSSGSVTVDGIGSTWNIDGSLFVGGFGKGTLIITNSGSVSAEYVSINDQSLAAIDVGHGSSLNIDSGNRTIVNEGKVRILAGVVPAAGTVYMPIVAGKWWGAGTYQAVGGTWNDTTHEFTASPLIMAASGQRLAFDRATIQRVKVDDAASGWTVGASFLAAETSTAFDITVTAIDGTVLADLADHLDPGDVVLGAWDFDVAAGYTSGEDPAYLSFEVGSGWSRDDLEVWHFDGADWTLFDAWDLTYDGTYASFTVDELSGYAIAPLKEIWVPGDCDGDNRVDEDDAAILAEHWGEEGGRTDGDFNDDGMVDATDAAIMAANWGDWTEGNGPSNSVPEPGTIALLLGLGLVTLRRANRRIY